MNYFQVVLVDEGTANLDKETEITIQTVLRTAFRCSTILFIAHRLAGLEHMHRIVVIDKGVIVESGLPADLENNQNSFFHQLLKEQNNVQNEYSLVPFNS